MNRTILTSLSAVVLTAAFTGCRTNEGGNSTKAILANPSPQMDGLAETYPEDKAGIAVVNNVNDRLYVDDWRRTLLLDKPSALSVMPVVQN